MDQPLRSFAEDSEHLKYLAEDCYLKRLTVCDRYKVDTEVTDYYECQQLKHCTRISNHRANDPSFGKGKEPTPARLTRKGVRPLVGWWGIIIIKQRKERDCREHEREQSPSLQGQELLGRFRKHKNISPYYTITYIAIQRIITHTTPQNRGEI
ncbi:hypothetical protein AVEN_274426-1 [Araneus ventricosus]|uniref:Uncharacterized protein n=1 Tax=Araneus ventricosus TaxID=182803 RepID=A0A4Y2E6U9_ARAVE|nr:hypothetical protein AVEN_274426-1 [Araneus ventricosus]